MPLTGELVEIATFDQNTPQGLASTGDRLFLIGRTQGYAVDTSQPKWTFTPFTRQNYADTDKTFSNRNVRCATYRNGKILVFGQNPRAFFEIDIDTGEPTSFGKADNLPQSLQGLAYNATENTLYALDRNTDRLYRITNNLNRARGVGKASAFGNWGENNPQGLSWYRGKLIGVGNTRHLAILNTTDGTAEPQGINFGTVESTPTALVEHAGDLLLVGNQHDKIYRCRDVRWDDNIPAQLLNAGETKSLDLTTVSTDGQTFAFKNGYTPPNYITLNGSQLTIAAPNAQTATTETVQLTVARNVSNETFSEDTEIVARIAAARPPDPPDIPVVPLSVKQATYQGHPVAITVKIHDQDVTDDLASVDDIGQSVDYPNLTEFRVGEASFTIRDVHGDFSPNNASNFFTRNGGRRTGRHSPIEIETGFIVDGQRYTETVFRGNIIRLVQDATPATVRVVCSDNFGDMRTKGIADFGVPRHFMLTEDLEQSAENGFYPIMDAIMPASHGSVSLKRRVNDEPIAPVQKLQTEGTLDPKNFIIDDRGVRTEGGRIVNRGVGYPQLRMKSPYRYRHISDVITDILNHAGITKSDIAVPERDVAAHFSSNGRVNYDLIGNIGSGNPVTWNGYVTDFLHDSDKWYFLYNKGRGNPNGFSQVIAYDISTRTYTKLHGFSSATEVWRFTKSGNNLYIVATTGGNYDANESSCETRIIQLDIATQTETVLVAHTVQLQPQLSHYYHGVGSAFHKPDSRRPLIYRENDGLYFAYVDRSNSQFGIAKSTAPGATPTALITMNMDDYENHGGIGFDINGSTLFGAMTFTSGGTSQTLVFKKSL